MVLNLEHIKNTCLYYLINSPDAKREKGGNRERAEQVGRICRDFAWHKQFIAEKAFDFESFLNRCTENQKVQKTGITNP